MASGKGLVERARKRIGEPYILGARAPKDDPNWRGPWDCAEFISWLVYQEAGVLYGCDNNKEDPRKADAFTGYWERDAEKLGIRVSPEKAKATVGGILLRYPPVAKKGVGHIVLSDGHGGTIEAMGKDYGVKAGKVDHRGTWHAGILLPEIAYDAADESVKLSGPSHLFALNAPNMNPLIVRQIQEALKAKGFDPGAINGDFGRKTMEAVVAFQEARSLVVDGEVGKETAKQLGISLTEPAPGIANISNHISHISDSERSGTMLPLIPIALQLLPGLIKFISSDKAGPVKDAINKAVGDITGTTDSTAAQLKIESNPAVAAQLQLRLAEIAAEQEEKRNQARLAELKEQREQEEQKNESRLALLKRQQEEQLALVKAQQELEADRRRDEFERLKAGMEDMENARRRYLKVSTSGGPVAWAPIIISLIVTAGFFGVFLFLVSGAPTLDDQRGTFQLVNLTLGALVAAFTTVVSFWLGSSQGSRIKDLAVADMKAAQSKELTEPIESTATSQVQAPIIEVVRPAPPAEKAANIQPCVTVKRSNFQKCVDIVLAKEGGFSNHPADKGGATNFGITLDTLGRWRKERGDSTTTVDDVKNLTRDEACEVYRTNYWNKLKCDDLPAGIDLVTFDFGVNAGPGRAAKLLQNAVGAKDDGSVGDATIAATKVKQPQELIRKLCDLRLNYYRQLSNFDTFGRGWTNRNNDVERAALTMAEPVSVG